MLNPFNVPIRITSFSGVWYISDSLTLFSNYDCFALRIYAYLRIGKEMYKYDSSETYLGIDANARGWFSIRIYIFVNKIQNCCMTLKVEANITIMISYKCEQDFFSLFVGYQVCDYGGIVDIYWYYLWLIGVINHCLLYYDLAFEMMIYSDSQLRIE